MQTNISSITSASRTLALASWRRWPRPRTQARPFPLGRSAGALLGARAQALRGQAWENTAWVVVALSGLGAVVLSLWV